MTELKLIRPSEHTKILAVKAAKEERAKAEAEAAAAGKKPKKGAPPPDERLPEEDMEVDMNEEPTVEFEEPIPEP
jgi:hypothetical protein